MVAVLVATTILALLAADYVLRPRRQQRGEPALPLPPPEPVAAAVRTLPSGIFVQPTFTWTTIEANGLVTLGVHPMLFGLLGPPYDVRLLADGESVTKRDPLVRIGKAGRTVTVRAPLAGRIREVNRMVTGEVGWYDLQRDGGSWLYRIEAEHVDREVSTWMIADQAADWTQRQYARVRDFLVGFVAAPDVARTMADGGEIPVGVLADLDDRGWAAFEAEFLRGEPTADRGDLGVADW